MRVCVRVIEGRKKVVVKVGVGRQGKGWGEGGLL